MKLRNNNISLLDLIFTLLAIIVIGCIYYFKHKPDIDSFTDNYYNNYSQNNEISKLDGISKIHESYYKFYAGVLALIGIYLTWRRTNALDEQNKNTSKQIEILEKQNTINQTNYKSNNHNATKQLELLEIQNRTNQINIDNNFWLTQFSKASDLLKDESISAKISGVYLFEKIMNNCEEYHWSVVEILSAYVRESRSINKFQSNKKSDLMNTYDEVIMIIINVVSKRNLEYEYFSNTKVPKLILEYKDAKLKKDIITLHHVGQMLSMCRKVNLTNCNFTNIALDKKILQILINSDLTK